eukprot:COSAG02_NODE_2439_length_8861_cov_85.579548_2_plen_78_part_00
MTQAKNETLARVPNESSWVVTSNNTLEHAYPTTWALPCVAELGSGTAAWSELFTSDNPRLTSTDGHRDATAVVTGVN